jgi:uncharacterized membrane protein YfcA
VLVLVLLATTALAAGIIDAIAGGGGLLTVPALLVAIADPRLALGTNKGQSVFGSGASLIAYARHGRVDKKRFWPTFVSAAIGSAIGARLLLAADPKVIRPIVLMLLLFVALFFASRGRRKPKQEGAAIEAPRPWVVATNHPSLVAAAIALVIGAYDGFFGPGTGTFLILAYTTAFGEDLTRATANAKVANFASNLAAVVSFALARQIDVRIALPMAAAQAIGGVLGARAAVKGGERLIRAVVLLVALALSARLAYQIALSR